jgi:ABC-type Fe3+-hydroxamate transport system substrate-binding protein
MLRSAALTAGAALVLAACATTGRHVTAWGEITLAPGDTGTCQSNPCRVFLLMPPGTGTYAATANEVGIGALPAGRTVSIGSFFESQAIKFPGTELPPAYVYIPNVR